jgi:serine/threonine-protein kinase
LGVCPACLLEAELPAATLGDSIELLEEVGRGGMGTVYKARHLRLGRLVAVKFIDRDLAADPGFEKRFDREARALALLNHPGIVAVHDYGREGEHAYIVMEYVEGQALSRALPLSPERARAVAIEACDALAHAHRQGVVHRDVKPDNVLLDSSGRVKVSDFGIARLLRPEGEDWAVTAAGGVVGSPAYMAPEALAGAPPDPRMDVYSLGVVLHEMVAGRRPAGEVVPMPGGLDRIVRKAVDPDPRRRFATADEMRASLEAAEVGTPSGALDPDERNWLRAVALLHTLATAAVLWALLLSLTPKVIAPGEVQPLIMLGAEAGADGRVVSRARFETWPTLAALAAVALAVAAHALLRRHWKGAGLDRPHPERPVPESAWVLAVGVTSLVVYAVRLLLEASGFSWVSPYVPILGGIIEIGALFFAWIALLEAWRTARPLRREGRLWIGLAFALVPPVSDLLRYLASWRP